MGDPGIVSRRKPRCSTGVRQLCLAARGSPPVDRAARRRAMTFWPGFAVGWAGLTVLGRRHRFDHGSAVEMPADLIGPAVEGSRPSVANRHCPLPVHHASVLQSLVGSMLCSYVTLALFLAAGLLAAWAWKTSDNSRPAAGDRAVASAADLHCGRETNRPDYGAGQLPLGPSGHCDNDGGGRYRRTLFWPGIGDARITYDTGAKVVLKGPACSLPLPEPPAGCSAAK